MSREPKAVVTAPRSPKAEQQKKMRALNTKGSKSTVTLAKQKMVFYNGKRAKPITIAQSLRTLAMVLKVGEAEPRALEVVGNEFKKYDVGRAYLRAAGAMRIQGATFKQAMLAEDVFPRTARELIDASPTSQAVQAALTRSAKLITQGQNVKQKLLTALIQPGFMLGFALIFLFAAATWIVPGFIGTFAALNAETPPTVSIVIAAAEVTKWVLGAILILTGLICGFWFGYGKRNKRTIEILDTLTIRTPLIGPIVQLAATSRLFELLTVNLMTGRGEPLSLESAGAGCGNEAIHAHAVKHAALMREGKATMNGFAASPLFPNNARYMLAAAPSVKQQIDIMNELAPEYRMEADNRLETFSKTIEPLVNYVVYAVVGLLIVAVVVPMYAMFPAIMDMDAANTDSGPEMPVAP
jgi:type IV pilus assembly protein PilC